jgi:hypothetical protein
MKGSAPCGQGFRGLKRPYAAIMEPGAQVLNGPQNRQFRASPEPFTSRWRHRGVVTAGRNRATRHLMRGDIGLRIEDGDVACCDVASGC